MIRWQRGRERNREQKEPLKWKVSIINEWMASVSLLELLYKTIDCLIELSDEWFMAYKWANNKIIDSSKLKIWKFQLNWKLRDYYFIFQQLMVSIYFCLGFWPVQGQKFNCIEFNLETFILIFQPRTICTVEEMKLDNITTN